MNIVDDHQIEIDLTPSINLWSSSNHSRKCMKFLEKYLSVNRLPFSKENQILAVWKGNFL